MNNFPRAHRLLGTYRSFSQLRFESPFEIFLLSNKIYSSEKQFKHTTSALSEGLNLDFWLTQVSFFKLFLKEKDCFSTVKETCYDDSVIYKKLISLLSVCKTNKIKLNRDIIIRFASVLSEDGNEKGINCLLRLYMYHYPVDHGYCELLYYLVRRKKTMPDTQHLLQELENMYFSQVVTKSKVLKALRLLIIKSVFTEGKANVGYVCSFAESFSINCSQPSILGVLWLSLLYSPWYEDQITAKALLNSHKQLQDFVALLLPHLVRNLLSSNKINTIHDLLESLLNSSMKSSYEYLLRCLFDYYYQRGFLKRCEAVFDCCDKLEVTLSKTQLMKCHLIQRSSKSESSSKNLLNIIYKF